MQKECVQVYLCRLRTALEMAMRFPHVKSVAGALFVASVGWFVVLLLRWSSGESTFDLLGEDE